MSEKEDKLAQAIVDRFNELDANCICYPENPIIDSDTYTRCDFQVALLNELSYILHKGGYELGNFIENGKCTVHKIEEKGETIDESKRKKSPPLDGDLGAGVSTDRYIPWP